MLNLNNLAQLLGGIWTANLQNSLLDQILTTDSVSAEIEKVADRGRDSGNDVIDVQPPRRPHISTPLCPWVSFDLHVPLHSLLALLHGATA